MRPALPDPRSCGRARGHGASSGAPRDGCHAPLRRGRGAPGSRSQETLYLFEIETPTFLFAGADAEHSTECERLGAVGVVQIECALEGEDGGLDEGPRFSGAVLAGAKAREGDAGPGDVRVIG